jgi:hypothetical protein
MVGDNLYQFNIIYYNALYNDKDIFNTLNFDAFIDAIIEYAHNHQIIDLSEKDFIAKCFDRISVDFSLNSLDWEKKIIDLLYYVLFDEILLPLQKKIWFNAFEPMVSKLSASSQKQILKWSLVLSTLETLSTTYYLIDRLTLLQLIEFKESVNDFIRSNPLMKYPLFLRAAVFYLEKDFLAAIQDYEEVLRNPHPPSLSLRIWHNLVLLNYATGDMSAAKKYALLLQDAIFVYFTWPKDQKILSDIGLSEIFL